MRYLSGMVAGRALLTQSSSTVGYLAAFPVPRASQTSQSCRAVDPSCDVSLMWIGTWGDPEKETMAANKLWVEEGARIISQHSDTTEPQIVFSDNGPARDELTEVELAMVDLYPDNGLGIGYHSDMRELVGDSVLTSVRIDWTPPVDYFVRAGKSANEFNATHG
mmetsp:Transcript_97453/g.278671  ORF Transcript_97453/g.278671 Transcript_97453/m.278671 type:complete len:164 (-) Transcript_97453:963-1454(-)